MTITEASSERERREIYALRYAVYVEEMGRRQRHADHASRLIAEPEDESAVLLMARAGDGAVVGTARVHLKDRIPREYVTFYRIDSFGPFHPSETSTTTKLMVAHSHRRSTLGVRLAQACYRVGMDAGVSFNFIDCSPRLREFFDRLGYRQLFPDLLHAEYGVVSPLILALHDHEYLRQIGSPLTTAVASNAHPSVSFLRSRLEQSAMSTT